MPSTTRRPVDKDRAIFLLHLIKPSHYDDDGYVIQWLRSDIPSNTLAALYGIARDCDERRGPRRAGRDADLGARRDQPSHRPRPGHPSLRGGRRQGAGRAGRGAVEPVPARDGPRPAAARGRHSGLHRRVSRRRQPRDAARAAARDLRSLAARDLDLLRRGGRPARRGAARCLRGPAEASLRLHVRPAQHRRGSRAVPGPRTRSRAT